jgi:hypothetical protein
VPDHSTFSKNRHGRFRQSDLFRRVFESVLRRCIEERLVGGEGFAVDASLIKADANRQKGIEGDKGLPSSLCILLAELESEGKTARQLSEAYDQEDRRTRSVYLTSGAGAAAENARSNVARSALGKSETAT